MLNWAKQFSIHVFFDNNSYAPYGDTGYECLLSAGCLRFIDTNLEDLQQLHDKYNDWITGHISYDYKNLLESKLTSAHIEKTGFPLIHFFIPETVCYINKEQNQFTIAATGDADRIYEQLMAVKLELSPELPLLGFKRSINREEYIAKIQQLRTHIANGDCYEINYCNMGYCENAEVDPLAVFNALNSLSPAPFAAYYRLNERYMMCASPERYLRKTGDVISTQPIKGTARRSSDNAEDEKIKTELRSNIKEQAENVMIVDLARNDLARTCNVGSVRVNELFGLYTYPQVHHLISTISGTLRVGTPLTDAIKHSFPMGSMTGAPKNKVMELIEQHELSRRELFSGTIGYIDPSGNFDFNVIIRSLFYNTCTRFICYQTGGAITFDSIPEQEWEETRLKAWALERIFS